MIMDFKCECSLRGRTLGDGCQICNTGLAIDQLMTPQELCDELENNAFLTADQSLHIAQDVYQPLLGMIKILSLKIDRMAREVGK